MKVELDLKEINRLADEFEKQTGHRATRIERTGASGTARRKCREIPRDIRMCWARAARAELNLDSPMLEKELLEKNR